MRAVVVVAIVVVSSANCAVVPPVSHRLPDHALRFADLRALWSITGAGFEVAYEDDGVTLTGGPGALVVALDDPSYRVHVQANVEKGGNSGVFLRGGPGIWFPKGIEVQIDPADPKNPTGSLYGRVRSKAPIPAADTWFTIDAVAQGNHVEARINGVLAGTLDDAPADGPIFGLQAHYPGSVVHFRELSVESLR